MNIFKRLFRVIKSNKTNNISIEESIRDFEDKMEDIRIQLFDLKKLKKNLLSELNKYEEDKKQKISLMEKNLDKINNNTLNYEIVEENNKCIYQEIKGIDLIINEYTKQIQNIEKNEKSISIKITEIQNIIINLKVKNSINDIQKNNIEILKNINYSSLTEKIDYQSEVNNAYQEIENSIFDNNKEQLSNSIDEDYLKFIKNLNNKGGL